MQYTFKTFGHSNILANHVKTIEFTKDDFLTERGDCIVGINSTFELEELKKFSGKVKFACTFRDPDTGEILASEFKCKVNPKFNSDHELVLRKSGFSSDRTFGVGLKRGSNHMDRRMVELMQDPKALMEVTISEGWH